MAEIFEPKSDNMDGFDEATEKVVTQEAALADGTITTIEKRVALSEGELQAKKEQRKIEIIAEIEDAIYSGKVTAEQLAVIDGLYKIKQLKL